MKLIWSKMADRQLDNVAEYIRENFGTRRRKTFLREVHHTAQLLKRNPNMGPIDPLFANRPITYRSVIINNLNKLVYFIEDDTIHVAAFWDTRMEPEEQARQVQYDHAHKVSDTL